MTRYNKTELAIRLVATEATIAVMRETATVAGPQEAAAVIRATIGEEHFAVAEARSRG